LFDYNVITTVRWVPLLDRRYDAPGILHPVFLEATVEVITNYTLLVTLDTMTPNATLAEDALQGQLAATMSQVEARLGTRESSTYPPWNSVIMIGLCRKKLCRKLVLLWLLFKWIQAIGVWGTWPPTLHVDM
jgi:hypothetical protein